MKYALLIFLLGCEKTSSENKTLVNIETLGEFCKHHTGPNSVSRIEIRDGESVCIITRKDVK